MEYDDTLTRTARMKIVPLTIRRILAGIALLLLFAIAYAAYTSPHQTDESYAVYSTYLEQSRTGESHDLGRPEGLVLILDHTSTGMFRVLAPFHSSAYPKWTRLDMALRNLISRRLTRKFSLRGSYLLVPSSDMSSLTETQLRTSYGIVTFSKVTFSNHGSEADFYSEHLCGLCGDGGFVHMVKKDGVWRAVGKDYTWIS